MILSDNDDLSEEAKEYIKERNLKILRSKGDRLEYICRQQFYLAYSANISVNDTDDMSVAERDLFYKLLLKQLDDEKKAAEEVQKKQQQEVARQQSRAKSRKR